MGRVIDIATNVEFIHNAAKRRKATLDAESAEIERRYMAGEFDDNPDKLKALVAEHVAARKENDASFEAAQAMYEARALDAARDFTGRCVDAADTIQSAITHANAKIRDIFEPDIADRVIDQLSRTDARWIQYRTLYETPAPQRA
ncbi:MAG: hypothetical protein KUA43_13830 [Hoeflea sp.]|uniref:hypothetical protein n=1 Tax=Hoeflea sp. TaxID=1940281 RepID=UPI001E0758CE|nr:hypothetical protein [Hoeflea sp.]MBU4531238.1 hypothetical protein [Alphaproteobacteria bacterium]MBU4545699.1 hypothetical protein [Alphaproteobacteria bacterium]MBU4550668.1 hypothetical protein [Alphaproteobacteria bacterium]MBV1724515.1 hypothetical protein [Hoeflea sp.]MBV1760535.1 hypothetical protein [Hoeflea sp.]